MKKKAYIKPEAVVVDLQLCQPILTASLEYNTERVASDDDDDGYIGL